MKAIFLFDVNPLVLSKGAVDFCAGSVSPVKLLSSIAKSIASNILISAGTLSPIFKYTISPGTKLRARNVSNRPSLKL